MAKQVHCKLKFLTNFWSKLSNGVLSEKYVRHFIVQGVVRQLTACG